jgi:hypothetical protein
MRWEWEEAHASGPVVGNGSTVHLADAMTGRMFLMKPFGRRRHYHYLLRIFLLHLTIVILRRSINRLVIVGTDISVACTNVPSASSSIP